MGLFALAIECKGYIVSAHCQKAMDLRNISLDHIIETISYGEIIANYKYDKPFPSKLILKFVNERPLHVVVVQDSISFQCILITAYWPDIRVWEADFKNKKIE